ncbi:hypothetical protein B0H13DRAFT_2649927 [Mycena leptocephala]|nr:hypothetical protein B0H13DRAFT_2649927 [Mycena leptocephala]
MPTSHDSKPLPVDAKSARLDKPLVIPRVLEQPRFIRIGSRWGKPFVRAFSPVLEAYGITKEEQIDFIDELNIKKRGNLHWQQLIMGGQMVKQVGHLDPTQIVKAVGVAILAIGKIAAWNSACGPNANKASILSAAQLRERLGMKPDADLALPMEYESTNGFSQKDDAGQRAPIRSPHRQILALEKCVTMADLAAEADVAWRSETNGGGSGQGRGYATGMCTAS